MDPWSYKAPSSGNILSSVCGEDFSEEYFNGDHEGLPPHIQKKQSKTGDANCVDGVGIKQEMMSPTVEVEHQVESVSPIREAIKIENMTPAQKQEEVKRKEMRRRSMSVCAIMEVTEMVSHVTEMSHGIHKIHLSSVNTGNHTKTKHDDMSTKSFRSMSSASSHTNLSAVPAKFVSMAEAIYHLQKDTPERFHSYSKKRQAHITNFASKNFQPKERYIPQSPCLLSKTRKRNIKILSQKEIEDLEYEEVKSYHIKANPIPKSVIYGSHNNANVVTKAPTKPVPFNLTQIRKKPPAPEKKIAFTAKPVPKHLFTKPVDLPKTTVHVTVPKSPKFISKSKSKSLENVPQHGLESKVKNPRRERNPLQVSMDSGLPNTDGTGHSGVPLPQKIIAYPCKPKPFSFEQRDKEMMRKKEEKIQMVFEEEKKLREFHANPIRTIIKKGKGMSPKCRVYEKRIDHKKENKENESDEQNSKHFKARPPVVLFKSPFRPQKTDRPVLEPCQVQLTTEVRALKRNIFNQALKEKEEQVEQLKKLEEEEKVKREEGEIHTLRAQAVHKACPVRHYQPMVIHPSEVPLTKPESPKFISGKL